MRVSVVSPKLHYSKTVLYQIIFRSTASVRNTFQNSIQIESNLFGRERKFLVMVETTLNILVEVSTVWIL